MVECSVFGEAIELHVLICMWRLYPTQPLQLKRIKMRRLQVLGVNQAGALFVLGQESLYGLVLYQDTVSMMNPLGKVCNTLARIIEKF